MTGAGVVIVGAGLAGARAAETLRSEGYDGRVALIGDELLAPYERPALSKEFLAGARDEQSLLLRPDSYWDERGIQLVLGDPAVALDPVRRTVRTRSGVEHRFDHAVVATGARPRRLPGERPLGVHELRTVDDARRLRAALVPGARLVVVGAGFVGGEVASTAHRLGVDVTIVEAAGAPLERILGRGVGRLLADRWRSHGVDVRLRTGLAHIRTDAGGRVAAVLLTSGDTLRADAVLLGIGVEPARELLPARPAQRVHAAGDVTGSGHWTAAARDGTCAARRILALSEPDPQPQFVWSDQFGLRLQVVGLPRPSQTVEIDGSGDSFVARYLDEDGTVRAGAFANRPLDAAALRRTLADEPLRIAA